MKHLIGHYSRILVFPRLDKIVKYIVGDKSHLVWDRDRYGYMRPGYYDNAAVEDWMTKESSAVCLSHPDNCNMSDGAKFLSN